MRHQKDQKVRLSVTSVLVVTSSCQTGVGLTPTGWKLSCSLRQTRNTSPSTGTYMISSNDIRACIPARFNGRDTDLLVAEAVIDELENTEIPADGMTMN